MVYFESHLNFARSYHLSFVLKRACECSGWHCYILYSSSEAFRLEKTIGQRAPVCEPLALHLKCGLPCHQLRLPGWNQSSFSLMSISEELRIPRHLRVNCTHSALWHFSLFCFYFGTFLWSPPPPCSQILLFCASLSLCTQIHFLIRHLYCMGRFQKSS